MAAGGFVGWSGTPPAPPLKHRPQQHFGIAAHVGFSVGRGAGAGGSWLSHCVSWCLSVCPCPQRLPFSSLHVSLSPKELPLPLSACRRSKYGEASRLAALPARSGGGPCSPRPVPQRPAQGLQEEMPWVASFFFGCCPLLCVAARPGRKAQLCPSSPSCCRLSRGGERLREVVPIAGGDQGNCSCLG